MFVIVEGPSDDTALGVILERIFSSSTVHVEITYGDITSNLDYENKNVVQNVADLVAKYAINNHFSKNHFKQIIHIIDTDGAYIPDSNIIEDTSLKDTVYCKTSIKTPCKSRIVKRNNHKRASINRLIRCKTIWDVPYQCYYMSCNLDHALYNKLNSTDLEKENDSYAFAQTYKDDIPGFFHLICNSDISVIEGYLNSWNFIKKDLHSLERHTNLGIALNDTNDVPFK